MVLRKHKRMKDRLNYKFPQLEKKFIQKELEILARAFNLHNKVRVKKLGKKLFFFE